MENMTNKTYEESMSETGLVIRNYLKFVEDNGFLFSPGDMATWKKKSQWVMSLHSENDNPAIVKVNGTRHWFKEGRQHRDSGPAIETLDGVQYFINNGEYHRENGPAIVFPENKKEQFEKIFKYLYYTKGIPNDLVKS